MAAKTASKAIPKTLPSRPASKKSKTTTKTKRKAEEETERPLADGVAHKRPKRDRETPSGIEQPQPVASKPVPKSHATKKPKVVKKREIINHAPTHRLNVYVFGDGSSGGELGLGSAKGQSEVRRPRLNPNLAADTVGVVQVACGGMHSACLTRDNKIMTWGVNDQGALGRDTTWEGGLRDVTEDDATENDSDSAEGELNPHEATPGYVDMSEFDEVPVFTQVACTDSATFAITQEGDVCGWGTFRVSIP